jgi:hypothetical protein
VPVHLARVDQSEDVRVLEVGDGLDLAQETFGPDDGGQFGSQDLDGDPAIVADVLRQIHQGHAALAELALNAVTVGEGGGQCRRDIRHARSFRTGRPTGW